MPTFFEEFNTITNFQLFLYSNFEDQMLILQIEEDIEDELVLGPEFW